MDGVAPGTPMRIRAGGLVPVCRTAPRNEAIDITLVPGRSVLLQFSAPDMASLGSDAASLVGVSSSDCPIPLASFNYAKVPTSENEPSRFMIHNFPSVDGFVLATPERRQQMIVPESGIINVR